MSAALVFDCAVCGIALVSGILGLTSGLIRELCGLLAVVVGVFVSTKYADAVGQMLLQYGLKTDNTTLLTISGFMILLIIIWSAFIIAGKLISGALNISGLGIFDRICGFIFGAGKFLVIASVIASCISAVPFLDKYVNDQLATSVSWPLLKDAGKIVANTTQLEYKAHLHGAKTSASQPTGGAEMGDKPASSLAQDESQNTEKTLAQ